MSVKTRREKRKAKAELPVETDWLWSCAPGMPLGKIVRALGFTGEPRTELSTHRWANERQVRDDLYRAFAPDIPLNQLAPGVGWDAFSEYLLDACADGRLIVLRDLATDVPIAVVDLVDIIGSYRQVRRFHFFESRPGARFALVLEGWTEPTISARFQRTARYTVRALEDAPS